MYSAGLREHRFAHDRLVLRDSNSRYGLYVPADVHQTFLIQRVPDMQMVIQHANDAGYGDISSPLSKPVHGDMQTIDAGFHCLIDVCRCQVIVVVSVKVESGFRITGNHRQAKVERLIRVQNAESVWQHETLHGRVLQRIYHEPNIIS